MRRVVFIVEDEVELFDLAAPAQVFHQASAAGAKYRMTYCGTRSDVASAQGLALSKLEPLPLRLDADDLVIVPGAPGFAAPGWSNRHPDVTAWLRRAHEDGATVASVCVGAFALAAAGLLDGRSATTHWKYMEQLQQRFPRVRVLENRLYVFDGSIATSAGISSGVDLALALVERFESARIAAIVARGMVVSIRRPGTQEQLSPFFANRDHLAHQVHIAQDWLVEHPGEPFTLDELAQHAGVSARTLTRQFKLATGRTVNDYSTSLRLEHARTLLKNRSLTIDEIAEQCGFADGRHLRRLWKEMFGAPPSAFRERSA